MEQLTQIFPSADFSLLGVILALPLLGAFVNGVFGKRLGKEAVTLLGLSTIGVAFLASLVSFVMLSAGDSAEGVAPVFRWTAWSWLDLTGAGPGVGSVRSIPLDVAFRFDPLNAIMSLVITGISFLIHLYSTKYMADDAGYYRFFAYLNLFVFSMLVLVLGDSLPILFVGWEGVGLCSYLLIGFWFSEDANASAGKKAFITNRIGDFGLLVGMGLLAYYVGALDWSGIEANQHVLLTPVKVWPVTAPVPISAIMPDSWAEWVNAPRYANAATLVALALFLGAMGKSAQFGLHVWLPDAMAGPTPVSALIHAATMVTAGVYLLCRMSGVFVLSPTAMMVVAGFGAFTALFAATIALVQNDIKKVLAYSTLSQLGYMFLGVGVGAFEAGFFHVVTHAFFKACLFLAAGSIIYAMHVRIHDTNASQDMRNMGGMRKFMPWTFVTFVAAWAAIAGFPFTAGFFSKDEIILMALTSKVTGPEEIVGIVGSTKVALDNTVWPDWYSYILYVVGAATAALTAFYMTRLVIGIFWGDFKGWKIVDGWKDPHADDHGHHHHEEPGVENMDGPTPKESPWQITWPLWALGGLSVFAGFLNAHLFHFAPLGHFLEPVFAGTEEAVVHSELAKSFAVPGAFIAVLVLFLPATYLAWTWYVNKKGKPAAELAGKLPGVHSFLSDKWRIDEFYRETIIGAVDALAEMSVWADKYIVDGIIARTSAFLVGFAGTILRQFQTGRVQVYSATMVVGLAAVGWYVIRPQANVQQDIDHRTGTYALTAAPGYGYSYRWDTDGNNDDDEWDSDWGTQREASLELPQAGQSRTIRLAVKNAFGHVTEEEFSFTRQRYDASAPDVTTIYRGRDGKLHAGTPPEERPGKAQGHKPQGRKPQGRPGDSPAQPKRPPQRKPGNLDELEKALQQKGQHQ